MERITREDFEAVTGRGGGPPLSLEAAATIALPPNGGFKATCRWKHGETTEHHGCHGAQMMRAAAKRHGVSVATRCRDGTLYVFRLE